MESITGAAPITISDRIKILADSHPHAPAVIAVDVRGNERTFTWDELEAMANTVAATFRRLGVDQASVVVIALPTTVHHAIAALGAWKLGCLVVPIDPGLAGAEREQLISTLNEAVLVDDAWISGLDPDTLLQSRVRESITCKGTPRSASATGGSTGKPRIVVRNRDWTYGADELPSTNDLVGGLRLQQISLVASPFYHAGFVAFFHCLALDHTVVLLEKFQPRMFVDLIKRHRVNLLRTVPAVMRALLDIPGICPGDFSSIEAFHHGGAPCEESVKRRWLELLPPEVLYEDYGSVERLGSLTIRGDEWLRHPGSVGRPMNCEIAIFDDDGNEVPVGQVGEIFMRSSIARQPTYVGPGPLLRQISDFYSVGDLGYMDDEGYLYVADRRSNVIIVGGAKVYPQEVSNVISRFPGVRDVLVTRRPHAYLGHSVHAIVVSVPDLDVSDLDRYCRSNLAAAKVPLSYKLVDRIPRNDAGKLQRAAVASLIDDRS